MGVFSGMNMPCVKNMFKPHLSKQAPFWLRFEGPVMVSRYVRYVDQPYVRQPCPIHLANAPEIIGRFVVAGAFLPPTVRKKSTSLTVTHCVILLLNVYFQTAPSASLFGVHQPNQIPCGSFRQCPGFHPAPHRPLPSSGASGAANCWLSCRGGEKQQCQRDQASCPFGESMENAQTNQKLWQITGFPLFPLIRGR